MAALTPGTPPASPTQHAAAIARVEAYLRGSGAPATPATTRAALEMVDSVELLGPCPPGELVEKAIAHTAAAVALRLDKIAAASPHPDRPALRAQLAWHLRSSPPAEPPLPPSDGLPPELAGQIFAAANQPVVPSAMPLLMTPQPLGDLPPLWKRLRRTAAACWLIGKAQTKKLAGKHR